MLQPGSFAQFKETTGDSLHINRLLDEGQRALIEAIGAPATELSRMVALGRIARVDYPLTSRHNPDIESDDRLTIIWHEDAPAIVGLETRDDFNFVDSTFGYLGPRR